MLNPPSSEDLRQRGSSTEAAPSLSHFGVIDIGSNSVRFVVFDSATRSPAYFFNEKVYCGLGAEIEQTGRLSPDGKKRALATLRRFAALSRRLDAARVETVATAAMRDAEDGPAFRQQIEEETGLSVNVISGEQEGRYAALGVLLGDPRAEGLVADIGGASLELAEVDCGKVGASVTTPLGPMRLAARKLGGNKLDGYIRKTIAEARPEPCDTLYLVGGGWRAFAAMDMARRDYPLHVLQGYAMTPEQALETAAWARKAEDGDLGKAGLSSTRARNAPWTAHVLDALINELQPKRLLLSACGLREGVLYSSLSEEMQRADPLTQSARVMERIEARFPGFGDRLAEWLAPVLPEIPERMRLAAALLADVNWRIHPDYRAVACFTTVTQSSLSGLTHPERIQLATALAYRYKNARNVTDALPEAGLLSGEDRSRAEALGRVIRLGAMLSAATPGILPECPLSRTSDTLTLTIPSALRDLQSETVEKRLRSAARAMQIDPVLQVQ